MTHGPPRPGEATTKASGVGLRSMYEGASPLETGLPQASDIGVRTRHGCEPAQTPIPCTFTFAMPERAPASSNRPASASSGMVRRISFERGGLKGDDAAAERRLAIEKLDLGQACRGVAINQSGPSIEVEVALPNNLEIGAERAACDRSTTHGRVAVQELNFDEPIRWALPHQVGLAVPVEIAGGDHIK